MTYTTNPYCYVEQVKAALAITGTTVDDEWIAGDLIPTAQAFIDQYCNRTWQQDGTVGSPSVRYYSGQGHSRLITDDIVSATQVLETVYNVLLGADGIWTSGTTQTTDITADCYIGPETFTNVGKPGFYLGRFSALPFIEARRNYQVTGVFGNPTIPQLITRACIRLAVFYYKMRDTNYASMVMSQDTVKQVFGMTVPKDVCEILEQFRRQIFVSR